MISALARRLAATRPGVWAIKNVVSPLDRCIYRLIGASWRDTPWVTPVPYAMILGGVSGVMAIVALPRDHALVLLVPAMLGIGAGVFLLGELLGLGG